jgi:hypothetical protein
VLLERAHEQGVVDMVEETLDIEFHNPVVVPTSPPHQGNRIVGRAPRPIAIGVWMEHRVDLRLQQELDRRLRHPIGNRGHAQHTHTTRLLRNRYPFDRRRKIAAGTESIP